MIVKKIKHWILREKGKKLTTKKKTRKRPFFGKFASGQTQKFQNDIWDYFK